MTEQTLAESIYEHYRDNMLPKGAQGKSIEDVQALIHKYAHLDRMDRHYEVTKELIWYKQGLR